LYMNATGIVRPLDPLGRVVIPMELRRIRAINAKDPIEFFVEGDRIILQKYAPSCVFCGSKTDVEEHKGKKICAECRSELAQI